MQLGFDSELNSCISLYLFVCYFYAIILYLDNSTYIMYLVRFGLGRMVLDQIPPWNPILNLMFWGLGKGSNPIKKTSLRYEYEDSDLPSERQYLR